MSTKSEKPGLKATIDKLRKEYGDSVVVRIGDSVDNDVQFLKTGIATVDLALGGGFPRGRITEIFGGESSTKTTLTLYAIAQAQREGGTCAFIDAEHALNPAWARLIGVCVEDLYLSQPNSGEEAWEIALALAESNEFAVIVVDSVSALTPEAEIRGDMTDASMGTQARMMSKGLRKLVRLNHDTVFIFINQIRNKITSYGNPETTSGGLALKFAASVRIRTQSIGGKDKRIMGTDGQPAGIPIKISVPKSKVSTPLQEAEFDLIYNEGIDLAASTIDAAIITGQLQRKGSWYYDLEGTRLANGRVALIEYIKEQGSDFVLPTPDLNVEVTAK